jgi:hypothetical protein
VEEVISYASTLVALGMVGRLGGSALGAYSLAHSVTNITGKETWQRSDPRQAVAQACSSYGRSRRAGRQLASA